MCRLSWNLRASASWNPQGLSRPVMGLLYLCFHVCFERGMECNSLTAHWLTLNNEVHFTLGFFFLWQFLQKQNPHGKLGLPVYCFISWLFNEIQKRIWLCSVMGFAVVNSWRIKYIIFHFLCAGSGHHQVLSFDWLKIILYNSRDGVFDRKISTSKPWCLLDRA